MSSLKMSPKSAVPSVPIELFGNTYKNSISPNSMDKIDIHETEKKYGLALKSAEKTISKYNFKLICDFLEASAIGKTARKNARKKQAGERTRLKNLFLLKIVANSIKKNLDKLNQKDMESFIKNLNDNKIKKASGEPYSEQTKANIKKTLIIFLRYVIKNKTQFSNLTEWIETSFRKKEPAHLTEEEIKKILNKCNTTHQKVLVAVLFDSGSRIEEFLNVRMSDIVKVQGDVPYYKLTLREEFSKTKGRTIGLFWKPTTEILDLWLETCADRYNPQAALFPTTYNGVRKTLHKLGKRAIAKSISPHLFRHSSATYYADKMNRQQLCIRYGWSFSSNMPDIYIARAGVQEKEIAEKFSASNLKEVNDKLDKVTREQNIQREILQKLIEDIQIKMDKMSKKSVSS